MRANFFKNLLHGCRNVKIFFCEVLIFFSWFSYNFHKFICVKIWHPMIMLFKI